METTPLLNERPHFASCDYITKRLTNNPDFVFPCTCDEVFRRIQDRNAALEFLKEHPEYGVSR